MAANSTAMNGKHRHLNITTHAQEIKGEGFLHARQFIHHFDKRRVNRLTVKRVLN